MPMLEPDLGVIGILQQAVFGVIKECLDHLQDHGVSQSQVNRLQRTI